MLTDIATSVPKRRKYMTASEVRQILQRQEASGISLYQYCRNHGLPYKTITNWRSKQNKVGVQPSSQPAFVSLEIKSDTASAVTVDAASMTFTPTMEVRLRHHRAICVRADFDVAALRRLVVALEGLPC